MRKENKTEKLDRVKLLKVPHEYVLTLLRLPTEKRLIRAVFNQARIAGEWQVLGVYEDYRFRCFVFSIYHPSFSPVPMGCEPEQIEVEWNIVPII